MSIADSDSNDLMLMSSLMVIVTVMVAVNVLQASRQDDPGAHLSAGDPLSQPFRENSLVVTRASEVKQPLHVASILFSHSHTVHDFLGGCPPLLCLAPSDRAPAGEIGGLGITAICLDRTVGIYCTNSRGAARTYLRGGGGHDEVSPFCHGQQHLHVCFSFITSRHITLHHITSQGTI